MKKIILVTALSICSLLAFDVGGALKSVGTSALNGNTDTKSLTKVAGESAGLTPQALGGKLASSVKSANPVVTSKSKAEELCSQASTVQSFANLENSLVKQAISICTENVMAK